jgi:aminoglycoside phosphotransferase (APT) family kinase protein
MHAQIEPWLPIPRCTQISEDGILLFGALPGVDLYDALVDGAPEPPAPSAIIDVLDRLPEFEDPPELWSSDEMVEDYRELISALVPEHASLVDRLAEALTRAEQQPVVPIHGDFHEGNILLDRSGISGVLDVDDAGYGERVEDLGLLLGRVWALGMTSGEASILEYADRLLREFSEQVDPLELRRRAGVAVLGRATSPFRNQMRDWRRRTVDRLELAEQWIEASGLAR